MRNFFFLLLLIPCLNFSQSGISLSGMSQFNIGESIMPQNNSYIPVSYEQRNNNITISIFRGRRFRIGTFAIKGSVSYNIENTKYHGTKNIDDYKVFSTSHNPLNIQRDLLNDVKLSLKGLYFYHFHYLPPIFENYFPEKFRRESWKLEKSEDWRGYLLASGFVVDCVKKD